LSDILLRRVSESRPGADGLDDYDVIGTDGAVIGRIAKATRFPNDTPWYWSIASDLGKERGPTQGYAPTLETAMHAFARSWYKDG
jgi:hypothetical protein